MTHLLSSPCRAPGCPEVVPGGGYCAAHRRAVNQAANLTRSPDDIRVYATATWRRLRTLMLQREPLCVECSEAAELVDHIVPIADGGAAYDEANLQTMCHRCHNRKRQAEGQQRTLPTPEQSRCTLICGSPGAPKVAYITANKGSDDIMLDAALLHRCITGKPAPPRGTPEPITALVQAMLRAAIAKAAAPNDIAAHIWITSDAASRAARTHLAYAAGSARIIVLLPSKAQCLAKLQADAAEAIGARREPQAIAIGALQSLVNNWFYDYEAGGEHAILGETDCAGLH